MYQHLLLAAPSCASVAGAVSLSDGASRAEMFVQCMFHAMLLLSTRIGGNEMTEKKDDKSFWTTVPGLFTGCAAMITAIATLLTVLFSIGIIKLPSGPAPTLTPAASAQNVPIEIPAYCGRSGKSSYAQIGQPVTIMWGWSAASESYRRDYMQAVSYVLQIDGRNVDVSAASQTLTVESGMYIVRWRLPSRILSQGSHQVVLSMELSRQITDGLDSDNDGKADTFGPNAVTGPPCEIIVR